MGDALSEHARNEELYEEARQRQRAKQHRENLDKVHAAVEQLAADIAEGSLTGAFQFKIHADSGVIRRVQESRERTL